MSGVWRASFKYLMKRLNMFLSPKIFRKSVSCIKITSLFTISGRQKLAGVEFFCIKKYSSLLKQNYYLAPQIAFL